MEENDIYGISRKLERYLELIKESKEITPKNKEAIVKFHDACFTEGLSETRVLFYVSRLYQLSRWLGKNFSDASREDIEKLMSRVEKNKNYTNWTKNIYKITLKKFYKWLEGKGEEYPAKISWIKTTMKGNNIKLPEELLTQDDITKLIQACKHPRDSALISVLYESGCRIGEIATLRIKNVSFDKYGALIIVNGKTGMRRVRLIASLYYLTNWLENHPGKKNPESPLWITLSNRHRKGSKYTLLNYANIRKRLIDIAEIAGVKKAVNPHIFRHSRATALAGKLTEAQMNQYLGWKQGSDMPSTYVHLSGRDVDSALLQIYGIKTKEESKDQVICARCLKVNDALSRYCDKCGAPLSLPIAIELEEKRAKFDEKIANIMEVFEDPEVKELIARKLSKK